MHRQQTLAEVHPLSGAPHRAQRREGSLAGLMTSSLSYSERLVMLHNFLPRQHTAQMAHFVVHVIWGIHRVGNLGAEQFMETLPQPM
jgi:hypothetical protein